MQLMSAQQNLSSRFLRWSIVWIGLTLLLASWPAAVLSQDPWSEDAWVSQSEASDAPQDELFGSQYSGRSGQAFGSLIRGGFVTGPGIGREDSFAPLEFMPYFFLEDGMFLGDLRGFRSVEDHYGANLGVGYRQYVRSWDRIFGVNFFYDYDNTSTQLFRQYGFGLETFGANWDMRLNTYFPATQDRKELSLEFLPETIRFSGNSILFDQLRTFGVHMKGLDHELAVPIPGRYMERHDVRAVAGWYHFEGQGVDQVWGWKGRVEGDVISNVHMGLEVTNDSVFDTNVVLQVAVSYGGFKQNDGRPINQFNRMTTPIQRQYTAVIQRVGVVEAGLTATKADGTPYFVEHVASADPYDRGAANPFGAFGPTYDPTAPLGSFENPFLTIQQAQAAAGGDIVYTWTNSVFDNQPLVAEAGVQTLGEADGVTHTILLQPFGFVDLPRAIDNPDPTVAELRPLLTNVVGDGITLTSGIPQANGSILRTEVSGFRVGDANDPTSGATGNGIVGNNVTGIDADFNQINFAAGDGILLTSVGDISMMNTSVFNARGVGLHVDGGTPRITFEGDGDITNPELQYDDQTVTGGLAVLIENTNTGSFVDLFGTNPSAINYDNAGGILIQNAAGSARFGDIVITDDIVSDQGSIEITGQSSGAFTFARPVEVTRTLTDGLYIDTLQAGGQVTFQSTLDIDDRIGYGIHLLGNQGNVLFIDDVTLDTNGVTLSNNPGVSYLQSSGNVTFRGNLTLDQGNGLGIEIGEDNNGMPSDPANPPDNTGTFAVNGDTAITGYGGTSLRILEDDSRVTFDNLAIDARGAEGIRIDQQRGTVDFNGLTSIGNSGGSSVTAAVISRNTGNISFDSLTITNASSLGVNNFVLPGVDGNPAQTFVPVAGLAAIDNPGGIRFGELNIDAVFGAALFGRNIGVQSVTTVTPGTPGSLPTITTTIPTGGIFTNQGTISSIFEAAVDIDTSVIGLAFDSVSATQSARQGIRLVNNDVSGRLVGFQVDPGNDIQQAGGAIVQSALEGALFQNTGIVSLRAQDYVQNFNEGIQASNVIPPSITTATPVRYTPTINLQSMNIIQSGQEGLRTDNVFNVNVLNSTFTQNGGFNLAFPSIHVVSAFNPDDILGTADYNVTLDGLDISELGTDAILVETTIGGQGSTLDLNLVNSQQLQIAGTAAPTADILQVVWSGAMDVFVNNNASLQFFALGSGGVNVATLDPFALANVTITNNNFQAINTAAGNVFVLNDPIADILINTNGPSNILIDNNSFNNANSSIVASTTMLFNLAGDSNTTISNNIITDSGNQSIGVQFQSIEAAAAVTIFGNDFLFTNNNLFFDERGFDFQATNGQIDFFGSNAVPNPNNPLGVNNIVTIDNVQGAGFPWFNFPVNGQFSGSVLVNGVLQP